MHPSVYLALAALPLAMAAGAGYEAEILAWREQREASLKSDTGWLTVAGLFWLKEGNNTFGSERSNDIVLPRGPAHAGAFALHGGKVTVVAGREPARELKPDTDPQPDEFVLGDLALIHLKRGGRDGIRLRDKQSSFRREFRGLHWYPVMPAARVTARFVAEPAKIKIANVIGQEEEETSPGYALFSWGGKEYRLYPTVEDNQLFFVFRDLTAGKETYPAGRFFYSDMPQNGKVVLDFNKAYNPPCAFTPYATCPLPIPQNRLPIRVEAGELKYGSH